MPTDAGQSYIEPNRGGMANIYRVQFTWSGWSGAPGYTTMYFDAGGGTAQAAHDVMRAFLVTAAGTANNNLPAVVHIDSPPVVDTLVHTNGHLFASTPITPGATIVGNGSGNFAAEAGASITWLTGAFNANGHRIRGRTFLVPLSPNGFSSGGALSTTMIANLNSAAAALIAATPDLMVWTRPHTGASDGGLTLVAAGRINSAGKSSFLSSRRD